MRLGPARLVVAVAVAERARLEQLEAERLEHAHVVLAAPVAPVHVHAEELVLGVRVLAEAGDRREQMAARREPAVHAAQQLLVLLARQVEDRVEGDRRIERAVGEHERHQVGLDELRAGNVRARAANLLRREVDAHDAVLSRERRRDRNARAAAEVENARAGAEPRQQELELRRVLAHCARP